MEFETHTDMFLVLPTLAVCEGECGPDCDHTHLIFTIGWFVWSIHFTLP